MKAQFDGDPRVELPNPNYTVMGSILNEVVEERVRQLEKWGVQKLPDGTGSESDKHRAWHQRQVTDSKSESGTVTWKDVLAEEVFEAFAETDQSDEDLRKELIQVAVAWIEDIDTRLYPIDLSKLGPGD